MDALGNLTSVGETDPTYGAVSTAYTYDVLGHLTGVSMPRGSVTQTRTFNYNQGTVVTGYLRSATNPENGTVSYTYDANGRVATKTDAKNQLVRYTYDPYGRLTQVRHYPPPVAGQLEDTSQQVNYYYDSNPFDAQGFSQNTQGRLAAVTYAAVAVHTQNPPPLPSFAEWYSYVQAGGVSAKRLQIQQTLPPGYKQQPPVLNFDAYHTFDTEGKIATVQYPTTYPTGNPVAGPTYKYGFDAMDRPSTLTDQGNNTIVSGVSYGPSNELLTIAYGNYLTGTSYENRTYNSLLQLTGLTTTSGMTGAMNLTYTYPAAANIGKISSMTDAIVGETVQYTYDSLNRLIKAQTSSATTPWGQAFVYDGFGT